MDGLAIAASLTEVRKAAEGGFVRSIYEPLRGTLIVHVYAEGETRRILIAPRRAAIHVAKLELPNPATPSRFAMLLRRRLGGGRIVAVTQRGWDRVVTIDVERRDGRTLRAYRLVAELVGIHGNLHLLEGERIVGSAYRDRRNPPGATYAPVPSQQRLDPKRLSAEGLAAHLQGRPAAAALARAVDGVGRQTAEDLLRAAGDHAADRLAEAIVAELRRLVERVEAPRGHLLPEEGRATFYPVFASTPTGGTFGEALDATAGGIQAGEDGEHEVDQIERAIAARRRTLGKLRDWLDGAADADRLQGIGDLLMIHHREIPAKAERAVLTDPRTGREETIALAPSLGAIENAQRFYERAKRLRRGRPHVRSRICRVEEEIGALERAVIAREAGEPIADEAAALLRRRRPPAAAPEGKQEAARLEHEGFTILVGRSAKENDRLLRDARPDDLWLHAKGHAGAHVVVRRGGRREIPRAVIEQAARLAAERSRGRGERRVEVLVTEAKHVRKRKGAAAGLANVLEGDTLTIDL